MVKSTPVLEAESWSALRFRQDNTGIDKDGEWVPGKIRNM
jgi:hypothetical protein